MAMGTVFFLLYEQQLQIYMKQEPEYLSRLFAPAHVFQVPVSFLMTIFSCKCSNGKNIIKICRQSIVDLTYQLIKI